LPVTSTEIVGKFRKPPTLIPESALTENHLRLRLSPEVTIAMGMMVLGPGEGITGQLVEMVASRSPRAADMDAYERVLGAAMEGDAAPFAREDYVEEAWRIVDPVLKMSTPIYQYQTNTWGPREVERVTPIGGWSNPTSHEASALASGAAA
jgi:glucose-6-phosphate 1-dehydrogenase